MRYGGLAGEMHITKSIIIDKNGSTPLYIS